MKIPSFIVTLAGMLVFKGLALWLLAAASPSARSRPNSSCSARASSPTSSARITFAGREAAGKTMSTTACYIGDRDRSRPCCYISVCSRRNREKPRLRGRALHAVRHQERRHLRHRPVPDLHDGVLQGPAQRADRHGRPDRDLRLHHQAHDHRPAHLRHGRQRQGGGALGHQDRAAYLLSSSSSWACCRRWPG